jgi:hypothetical protein
VAQQRVTLEINHAIEVGNVDLTFKVRDGSRLVGTLTISKGTIDWKKSGAHTSVQKTWTEFGNVMK